MVKLFYPNFLKKALTLSYDDGTVHDRELVEILNEYHVKCTFNLNSGLFSEDPEHRQFRRLTKEEALDLYPNTEHEIAIHGVKHLHLENCSQTEAESEIVEDKKALEEMFRRPVCGMAYAFGTYNDEVVEMLRKVGVKYSRTTEATLGFDLPTDWLRLPATCHHREPKLMELADRFLFEESERLKLFYLWGHSYEFHDNGNWCVIEDFCKKVSGRDDVWYATNMEVYDYVEAGRALEETEECLINHSDVDLYLDLDGEQVILKAREIMAK